MEFKVKVHLLYLNTILHRTVKSWVEVELAIELPIALVVEIVRTSQDEVGRYQDSWTYFQSILVGAIVHEGSDRSVGEQLHLVIWDFPYSFFIQATLPVIAFFIATVIIDVF